MPADVGFDRALEAVADGEAVDWDAMERLARDPQERERVRCLRLLGEIGDLHRSTEDRPGRAGSGARRPSTSIAGPSNAPSWGRYRLVEKVGTGGFGQVYRAWDPELEREIAIKILHAHIRRRRLARAAAQGRPRARPHPPAERRQRAGRRGARRPRRALHGVRARSDARRSGARARHVQCREAVLIGEDVCRALAAVHRAGYLHRDVKAKNVMREQAGGRIVLMDFGTGREDHAAERAPGHRPDRHAALHGARGARRQVRRRCGATSTALACCCSIW